MSPATNEEIWKGKFGDEYTERNKDAYKARWPFWDRFCRSWGFDSVLEVGCNVAPNIGMISAIKENQKDVWGCDINANALWKGRRLEPGLNLVYASALDLPFQDEWFDFVFTAGVLIHLHPDSRERAMQEIIRVSNGYVGAIEYECPEFQEIKYRGLNNALYKGPWGDIYEKRYGLRPVHKERLRKDDGWDDCTFWLFAVR